jgi:flagellar basal-body rod modification protein FlgD
MAIDSVGAVLDTANPEISRASLQQEDFLKLLLTQLSFQDPLEPLDNQEFLAQVAQFTGLEQSRQTNDRIESLLAFSSGNQALELLGKTVEVQTVGGPVVAEVSTVRFEAGSPLLTVQAADGQIIADVSLSQITLVR